MSGIPEFVQDIIASPLKGVLIASAAGCIAGVAYWLNRLDDAKPISKPTKAAIIALGLVAVSCGIRYFSHGAPPQPEPAPIKQPALPPVALKIVPPTPSNSGESANAPQSQPPVATATPSDMSSNTSQNDQVTPAPSLSEADKAEAELKKVTDEITWNSSSSPACEQIRMRISQATSPFPMPSPFGGMAQALPSPNVEQQRLANASQRLFNVRRMIDEGKSQGCIAN